MIRRLAVALVALSITAAAAHAYTGFESLASSFQPRVPVSALGSMSNWFDPARFHMSSTLSVGSGYGSGTSAMQVTRFSYQFRAPLQMNVSVGNAFGAGSASGSGLFLEGLDLSYQPTANSVFRVQFQNVRSPLQYGYGAPERSFWGY
jgi:hypothetical protein